MKNKKKNNFHYKKYVLLTFIMVLISFSPNHSQKVFISGENNYNDENIANKQLDYLKPHNTGLISTHEMSARIESIAIWDDVAYVCDYDGYLNVVNISNPTEMEDITRRRIDSIFFNIQIDGNRVYVVHTFGMNIYDISDKWNPVLLVDLWSLNNGFHDIDIQNEIAYVTNRSSLICYDVSDPSSISKIRELDLHVESNGIIVADNIAYITASNYLLCIDVEDPYNPQYLANHTLEYDELGIEIEDKYLYVSDWANGLKIFDVSNPSAPYLIGEVDTIGYIQNIDIIDGFVYAAAGEGGLICIDVQDPYNPYVARYFKTISEFKTIVEVNDVDVCGGLIYVAERDYGLMVYRLEKYIENKGFSTYNTNIRAETVVIQDELAFVTNYTNGFQIINISDPQSPLFVSFYAGTIYDVDVEGNTVYTSGSVAISSINVDDPRNPIGIGNYDSSPATYSNSITVHNNIAYVAYYEKIYSFDVSNPSNPIFLDTITVAGSYDDSMIKIHGDIAYILCNNRLNAINITNPSALSLISTKWNSLDISDFTIFDDIAFLAADDDGIICLNISDPAAMVELSRFDFYGEYSVKSLEVKDQIIYLGCSSELVLFDCTDIYSMEYLIEYAIPDTAMGMSISGNLIAIACDRGGLYLIELETHVNNQIPTPYLKKIIQ